MKFTSNTAVLVVIAAIAACTVGAEDQQLADSMPLRLPRGCTTVNGPYGTSIVCQRMKREDAAEDEQPADSMPLRLRRQCTTVNGPYGTSIVCQRIKREDSAEDEKHADSIPLRLRRGCTTVNGPYGTSIVCQRMKREDSAEDEQSGTSLTLRLRRGCTTVNGPYGTSIVCQRIKREDLAEDEQTADSLALRLRHGCTASCGTWPQGCNVTCLRMKREDFQMLDATLGVFEDETTVGNHRARRSLDDNSAEEATSIGALQLRLRRGCTTVNGPYGTSIVCQRMKREDIDMLEASLSVYEDANDDALPLRVRRQIYGIGPDGKPYVLSGGSAGNTPAPSGNRP